MDRLPTKVNLKNKGVVLNSTLCPLCNEVPETTEHLFLHCPKSEEVRHALNAWWNHISAVGSLEALLHEENHQVIRNRKLGSVKDMVAQAYSYLIWKGRNEVL